MRCGCCCPTTCSTCGCRCRTASARCSRALRSGSASCRPSTGASKAWSRTWRRSADVRRRGAARLREGLQPRRAQGQRRRRASSPGSSAGRSPSAAGRRPQRRQQAVPAWLALQRALADRLVFSKLRAPLGGRLRFFISGCAALSREVAEFFHAADVLVLEGYGLTESSAATFVNRPENFKFGTVGLAVPGTESPSTPKTVRSCARPRRDARLPQPARGLEPDTRP